MWPIELDYHILCRMETADLVFRIIAAVGSIATFGALIRLIWADYFKRPVLEVDFDPLRDVRDQFNTLSPFHPRLTLKRSKWVRVCVVNRKGRRVARNARAFLIGAMPVNMSGPYLRNDSRPLPWQNDSHDSKPRDLHPGVLNWFDVLLTAEEAEGGLPTCAKPTFLLAVGTYRLAVQVTADEADPVTIHLLSEWDGVDWTTLKVVKALPGTWIDPV